MKKLIRLIKAVVCGLIATASNSPERWMIVKKSDIDKEFQKVHQDAVKQEHKRSNDTIARLAFGNTVTRINTIAQTKADAERKENRKRK